MSLEFAASVLAAGSLTLLLALASLLLASGIGLAAAFAKLSRHTWLVRLASTYTFVVRGVPDLVWILLIFYSLPALLNQTAERIGWQVYVEFSPLVAGIAALGWIFGAYMTETFRAALLAIPRGQTEAALACGLSRRKIFCLITLPQLLPLALPGFTNNWLVLAKATALASLIGLHDLMFHAKSAAETTGQPFSFYLLAAGFYLTLTLASLLLLRWLAQRSKNPRPMTEQTA